MPSYLLRPDRDVDFYVLWSTIVDAPIVWGPAATIGRGNLGCDLTLDRFARANTTGSSVIARENPYTPYGWDDPDPDLIVSNIGPRQGLLARAQLIGFCRHLDDDEAAAIAMLRPIDNGDES